MQAQNIIFIVILLISVIIHELAHGYAADSMGDPTPRLAGRLTLNPLAHLEWFGSVILPALLVILGAPFVIGWAKPVPFNPHYLKNKKWGGALVALAGPVSNIALAIIFALILKFVALSTFMTSFVVGIVIINVALAIFNLIPIPPLDGHHILYAVLPTHLSHIKDFLRRYSIIILVIFIMYGWKFISPIIMSISDILLSL